MTKYYNHDHKILHDTVTHYCLSDNQSYRELCEILTDVMANSELIVEHGVNFLISECDKAMNNLKIFISNQAPNSDSLALATQSLIHAERYRNDIKEKSDNFQH